MHPETSQGQPSQADDQGQAGTQPLGADVRLNADPDPDPDLDVTPAREPGLGEPAEHPDPPTTE
ncbi:MAG TPA: hypothetical protein VFN73_01820 [Propionibacteriaceae bacterium]|nr:hypothetical protein [Propionibacteriaceae bacterium]